LKWPRRQNCFAAQVGKSSPFSCADRANHFLFVTCSFGFMQIVVLLHARMFFCFKVSKCRFIAVSKMLFRFSLNMLYVVAVSND